jgi:GAF domain-containing protein
MSGSWRVDLVWVAVVTAVRAAFVLVVGGAALVVAGSLSSPTGRAGLWLGATVLVAGCVMASRSPVERLADRVAYGPDGDPYSALSAFVQRVSDTVAVDEVLPRVAQTVTQATHTSVSEVRLWLSDGAELREAWPPVQPPEAAAMLSVPLQRRGEQVGILGVGPDTVAMTENTRAVLDRLAGTAGLALANVRLTYDLRHRIVESRELADRLQRSRQRLLDAAAGQAAQFSHLVDARVQRRLSAADQALSHVEQGDPTALEDTVAEVTAGLEELRDIAAGIFPPTLADNGLGVALETFALRYDGRVRVSHRGLERRVPPSLETAAYFCCVRLVEDSVDTRSGVRVEVHREVDPQRALRVRVGCDNPPTPATVQLVQDRVEATHGVLARRTTAGGAEHQVHISWTLGGS